MPLRPTATGWRRTATLAALFMLAAAATAHVRLRYSVDGTPLRWSNPDGVSLTIQSGGSDDISDGSHATAIRMAVEAWNTVQGSRARIALTTDGQHRTDWQSPEVHLVLFDEDNASGFFPGASSTVALTPITFFTNGEIVDADVIFNGKNFRFATNGALGYFDVQDVATHELGHLLGLDHSGVCGATMYPYVDSRVILHRSLALDDERGMRHIYPASSFARITGTLVREGSGAAVAGAHVVARDADGRVASAILSGAGGTFALEGLDPGWYEIYVDPLDHPVSSANLGGGQVIETDFESKVLGSVTVAAGATGGVGTHELGADVAVQLGRAADDYPLRIVRGEAVDLLVRGAGLVPGSSLLCSDPLIALSNLEWFGDFVRFRVETPAAAPLGHVDLVVTDPGGATDVLVGGLEITPPDPIVFDVVPGAGDPAGGTSVTVTGENFRDGLRLVIGNRIYRAGESGGCVVVDDRTLTLTTASTIAGSHDVVVIDGTGVEGRLVDAFDVEIEPTIASTFPMVGSAAGGTRIVITGANFVPEAVVTIDGVEQFEVFVQSPTRLDVVTGPGVVGGPYVLRVISSGGLAAETSFTYVDAPDPAISFVTPDRADRGGGTQVSVFGSGFDASSRVVFGADPRTGQGGWTASGLELVDDGLVRVMSPSASVGTTSVLVRNVVTGQAATVEAGFEFTGQPDYGDDGGGCAAVVPTRSPTPRDMLGGAGWILVALALAAWRAWRVPFGDADAQWAHARQRA